VKQSPKELGSYLEAHGSSLASLRRQIQGEIAWSRLQQAKIESGVSVGEDEVKAVLDRLNASKGTEQYRVGEIFLSATPYTEEQTLQKANQILEQLRNGASFQGYARQYSEASTAAVGGDLGWVRPEQLPARDDPAAGRADRRAVRGSLEKHRRLRRRGEGGGPVPRGSRAER
jgi:peptidyl-prolyl cis-trans isomerase SurA